MMHQMRKILEVVAFLRVELLDASMDGTQRY
jgi:hypothetical protein